ncbi:MAG: hypothetical protein WC866_01725 [Patescibacteria group bacterium]|jgi:hypothetical protein
MQEKEPTIGDVLEAVKDGFGLLDAKIDAVDRKIDGVETRLDTKIGAVDARLNQKIDDLTTAVDGFAQNQIRFDQELVANRAAHERFEERLTSIENRA